MPRSKRLSPSMQAVVSHLKSGGTILRKQFSSGKPGSIEYNWFWVTDAGNRINERTIFALERRELVKVHRGEVSPECPKGASPLEIALGGYRQPSRLELVSP